MQFPKAINCDGKIHTFGIGLQALGTNFLQKYASLAKGTSKKDGAGMRCSGWLTFNKREKLMRHV
jgi:hypothetical protein